MPNRVPWEPEFSVGNQAIDDQHRDLLRQCEVLADLCAAEEGDEGGDAQFRAAFDRLMASAAAHFAAEEALLAAAGYPEIEDYRCEVEEYEYLAAEVVTPANFDKIELQRFLALWWAGHIAAAPSQQRPYLAARTIR